MIIKKSTFIGSYTDPEKNPNLKDMSEYAFIGRSNVGKSSLLNLLTGNSHLAKISSNPGKTQTMNFFLINEEWYLVDLPGYGFARVSREERGKWDSMVKSYLEDAKNLKCVFVLIDSRIDPQQKDLEFLEWLGICGIPFVIIFTKIDKIGTNQLASNVAAFKREFLKSWEFLPDLFYTSTITGTGKEEILNFIEQVNNK